jgi:uncharacterized protein DUF2846
MGSLRPAKSCFAIVLSAGCVLFVLAQNLWGQASTAAETDSPSVIYIFRPAKFAGNQVNPDVAIDGRPVSQIFNGTYLKLAVHPGKHTITATTGRRTSSVDLDAAVGETHYLEVVPKFSQLELVAVSKEEAEPAIAKGKAIAPFDSENAPYYSKAELKAENEKLKEAANELANSPPPSVHESAASGAPVAAAPASASPSRLTDAPGGAATNAGSSDIEAQAPPSSAAGPRLTDEQIQAAIQRGIDNDNVRGIPFKKTEWIRGGAGIAQKLFILSDSDRIAMAADAASHETLKVDRMGDILQRQKKAGFSISIGDAKSSAVLLGVVTVIVEVTGTSGSKVAEWAGPGYHIALEADGKTIEPLTDEEYQARAQAARAGARVKRISPWNYKAYASFERCEISACIFEQLVFPVIAGSQKLTVVVTNAEGHRKEKQIDPLLFAEQ